MSLSEACAGMGMWSGAVKFHEISAFKGESRSCTEATQVCARLRRGVGEIVFGMSNAANCELVQMDTVQSRFYPSASNILLLHGSCDFVSR